MRLRRCHLEAALLAGTSLHVAYRLSAARLPGAAADACALVALTCLSIWQELCRPAAGHGYITKQAASQGLALGALTVPWCFAALAGWVAGTGADSAFCQLAFRASAAASCFCLAALAVTGRQPNAARQSSWRAAAPQLLLAAFTVAAPLLSGSSGKEGGLHSMEAAVAPALVAGVSAGSWHLLLDQLPRCFTIGEALVVLQGTALLLADAAATLPALAAAPPGWAALQTPLGPRSAVQAFVPLLLAGTLAAAHSAARLLHALQRPQLPQDGKRTRRRSSDITVDAGRREPHAADAKLSQDPRWRQVGWAAAAHACVLAAAALAAVRPALWALALAFATRRRVAVLACWAVALAGGLPGMDWLSRRSGLPTIIVRKGYHLLAMALFAPALLLEPQLLAVGLAVAAAALLAAEAARVGGLPLLGPRIHAFMTSFLDGRDSGLLLVSHFSLLLGMAAPAWLCLPADGGAAPPAAFSGIVVLGVADSAASVLGRRFGRHRILETHKTVEGTAGGVASNLLAWWLLRGWLGGVPGLRTLVVASVATCLLEAATTQLDNIFLPLHHLVWLL